MADTKNLLFKRGTQAELNTLTSSVDGAFYLTTDTNKLYIGKGADLAPELLNHSIRIVENLPTGENIAKDTFYYVSSKNILCTHTNGNWVQINPDTNTDFQITGASFTEGTVKDGKLVYTLKLENQTMDVRTGAATTNDDISVDLTIKPEVLANIVPEAASVGLTTKPNGNKVDINTEGAGADSSKGLSLAAEGSVSVSAEGSTIKIKGTESTLSSAANSAAISLTGASGEATQVAFAASDTMIVVDGTETDKIKIGHKAFTTVDTSPTTAQEFISSVSLENGHVVGYTTGSVKDTNTTNASLNLTTEDDKYQLSLMDSEGNAVQADLTSLVEAANTYTNNEILKINSALQYQGTADTSTAIPTEPKNGWMYMASESGVVLGKTVSKGDLLIYHDTDWEIIPSGDEADIDTTYSAVINTLEKGVTYTLIASTGGNAGQQLTLLAGNGVALSSAAADGVTTVTIDHASYTTTPTEATTTATKSFTGVIGFEMDNGHIAKYITQTFTPETYGLVYTKDGEIVNQTSGGAVIGDKIKIANGDKIYLDVKTEVKTETDENEVSTTTLTLGHQKPSGGINTDVNTGIVSGRTLQINQVTTDVYGHVIANRPTTFTLPEDQNTTYKVIANAASNKIILQEDDGTAVGSISMSVNSANLNLSSTAPESGNEIAYQIGLVWDTF